MPNEGRGILSLTPSVPACRKGLQILGNSGVTIAVNRRESRRDRDNMGTVLHRRHICFGFATDCSLAVRYTRAAGGSGGGSNTIAGDLTACARAADMADWADARACVGGRSMWNAIRRSADPIRQSATAPTTAAAIMTGHSANST
jgi:hypothetical protein